MSHLIEDCSSWLTLLLIAAWYVYSTYYCLQVSLKGVPTQCFAANDLYLPADSIEKLGGHPGIEDVSAAFQKTCLIGFWVLLAQMILFLLANTHRIVQKLVIASFFC